MVSIPGHLEKICIFIYEISEDKYKAKNALKLRRYCIKCLVLFGHLIIGGILGWLAGLIIRRDVPGGIIGNIIAGIYRFMAWIDDFGAVGPGVGGFNIIPALIGAIILILSSASIMRSMGGENAMPNKPEVCDGFFKSRRFLLFHSPCRLLYNNSEIRNILNGGLYIGKNGGNKTKACQRCRRN